MASDALTDCYYYSISTCARGNYCRYRHSDVAKDLSNPICEEYTNSGRCQAGRDCAKRHPSDFLLSTYCYWETTPTGCQKPNCPYQHKHKTTRHSSNGGAESESASNASTDVRPSTSNDVPPDNNKSTNPKQAADTAGNQGKHPTSGSDPKGLTSERQRVMSSPLPLKQPGRGARPTQPEKSHEFTVKSFDEIMAEKRRKAAASNPTGEETQTKSADDETSKQPAEAESKAHAKAQSPDTDGRPAESQKATPPAKALHGNGNTSAPGSGPSDAPDGLLSNPQRPSSKRKAEEVPSQDSSITTDSSSRPKNVRLAGSNQTEKAEPVTKQSEHQPLGTTKTNNKDENLLPPEGDDDLDFLNESNELEETGETIADEELAAFEKELEN